MKGKILTLRNPWALLCFCGKDVENRNWSPWHGYTGKLWIHVAKKEEDYDKIFWKAQPKLRDVLDSLEAKCQVGIGKGFDELIKETNYCSGNIIGVVDLIGCVNKSDSKWADPNFKRYWLIQNPCILMEPFPATGKRGLWDPPEGLEAQVKKVGLQRIDL